jgi:3'-5' exoribonuclease
MENTVRAPSPKREKFITHFSEGDSVDSVFYVKFKKPVRQAKNGVHFLSLQVADKTGELPLFLWGDEDPEKMQKIFDSIKGHDIIRVINGKITEWSGSYQISIQGNTGTIEPAVKTDYNPEDFIATSKRSITDMTDKLFSHIEFIKNPHLHQLLANFFSNPTNLKLYTNTPAAMTYHQNWVGGLLEHSLAVADQAYIYYAGNSKELDGDLLIVGSLLHDVGKICELEVSTGIKVTEEGNFLGHIASGLMLVEKEIDKIPDFPEILKFKLLHIIGSHHGKLEFGALKEPCFPEALVIHCVDVLDSQVSYMVQQIEEAKTCDDWLWDAKNKRRIYLK